MYKKILTTLLLSFLFSGCNGTSKGAEETSNIEEPSTIELSNTITVRDVFEFSIPTNWTLLSVDENTYHLSIKSKETDPEPDLVEMKITELKSRPDTATIANFYTTDDSVTVYPDYECPDSYSSCSTVGIWTKQYFSVLFTQTVVGETSINEWDLVKPLKDIQVLIDSETVEGDVPSELYSTCFSILKNYEFMSSASEQQFKDSMKLDEENLYLTAGGTWWEGGATCTLFQKPDKTYLAAIEVKGCGPICNQEYAFFEKSESMWKEVTDEVLPELGLEAYQENYPEGFNPLLELPQEGTTLIFTEQYSDEILFTLKWQNGVFVKE